jgi:hypothetical protein
MIEKAHFGSFAQNGMWQTSQEVRHTVFFGFHTKFSKFHFVFFMSHKKLGFNFAQETVYCAETIEKMSLHHFLHLS